MASCGDCPTPGENGAEELHVLCSRASESTLQGAQCSVNFRYGDDRRFLAIFGVFSRIGDVAEAAHA